MNTFPTNHFCRVAKRLSRLAHNQEVAGWNPAPATNLAGLASAGPNFDRRPLLSSARFSTVTSLGGGSGLSLFL